EVLAAGRVGAARADTGDEVGRLGLADPGVRGDVLRRLALHPLRERGQRLREVARGELAASDVAQQRRLGRADLLRLPAAGPEPACRRRVRGARRVTLQDDLLGLVAL